MGQKGKLGKGLLLLFAGCCFPYIVTLGWTGSIKGTGPGTVGEDRKAE